MRPQANQGQQSGEQKKSVFDRLGRQLDPGRPPNRRSPGRYGEHPMHPGIHEPPPPDFGGGGRYLRGEGHPDLDWRYERRQQQQHMPFGRPDRGHPSQIGPPPMPPHYDMDVLGPGRQPPPYYQHPSHVPQFQSGPPGSMTPMLGGPDPIAMGMHHQRRPSPKYDRHGNPILGPIRMDHPPGVSPPRNFMGPPMPGSMMPPAGYDMIPMRPGMYPQERWDENMEMGPQMPGARLLPNDRFLDQPNQRFQLQQQQRQQKGPMMMNPDLMIGPQPNFEAPRYSKWRERRDVITNLDRQTAQSSSKTDSLKSSLQQPDNRGNMSKNLKDQRASEQSSTKQSNAASKKEGITDKSEVKCSTKKEPAKKKDPQDISDGEIIDDEDSSDDDDVQKATPIKTQTENDNLLMQNRLKSAYARKPLDGQFHEPGKRRRLHDRDEYSMDYETISDEELDDFMSDKKLGDDKDVDGKEGKNPSEIELLNALGLDWANLIEMSKQSRKETPTSDSALRRFSIPSYLPTLGISRELVGHEIYDLIIKITN